jgi:hypothetical protein
MKLRAARAFVCQKAHLPIDKVGNLWYDIRRKKNGAAAAAGRRNKLKHGGLL